MTPPALTRRHLAPRLAAGLSFLVAAALVPLAALAAPAVNIVSAEFGLFGTDAQKEEVFTPTDTVPHTPGQRYGWLIGVQTPLRSLSVREEYVLPEKPTAPASTPPAATDADVAASAAKNLAVPDLRRNQVSQRQLVPYQGFIAGEWSIGPDEPRGKRRLRVVVEGETAAVFEFEVK